MHFASVQMAKCSEANPASAVFRMAQVKSLSFHVLQLLPPVNEENKPWVI